MAVFSGPEITNSDLVFYYDMNNIEKSWIGKPTTNLIVTTPIPFGTYAYASGPVNTSVIDSNNQPRTVRRYTITSAVNTARANIRPSGLTTGVDYAFSFIIKYNGGNVATPTLYSDSSKGNPEGASNNNTFNTNSVVTTPLGNNWYQVKHIFNYSSCPTGACILAYGITTGTDTTYVNQTFDVYNEQFEISSFATPFVDGTRTNTQAVLDLTNNNTIVANSLTYASNNTFSFNGTTDRIYTSTNTTYGNNTTWEAWVNRTASLDTYNTFMGRYLPYFGMMSDNKIIFSNRLGGTQQTVYSTGFTAVNNTWYHLVFTTEFDGTNTTSRIYINGVLNNSRTVAGAQGNDAYAFTVGRWYPTVATSPFQGSVDNVKVYNRTLTAAEIRLNFEATRGRYGI